MEDLTGTSRGGTDKLAGVGRGGGRGRLSGTSGISELDGTIADSGEQELVETRGNGKHRVA